MAVISMFRVRYRNRRGLVTSGRTAAELGVVAGEIINPDALVGIPGVMAVESARPMPAPRMVKRPDGGR